MKSLINQPKPDAEKTFQQIRLLNAVEDTYGGVKVDVEESMDCNVYVHLLRASTTQWRKQGKKGVWIKLPIQLANLVEPTVKEGFRYHHAESDYLMLVQGIPETPDTLPANASHTVGIGAFVVNDTGEKTILEWTLIIISLLLEATSAIFEQLDYPLPSMVMAYLALLLFILDLILDRHDRHDQNREYFGFIGALGVVEYFGFAAAVWQCSHTTVGYHYSRQNLDNPIKMCLLPFIFALCVLISKAVKSNQHER
uniref:Pre-nudix hydrolase domain-containing protein n=1 Tax=Salix viminalis TaxID=40686 RepID=A0A6N2KIE2_SALVM